MSLHLLKKTLQSMDSNGAVVPRNLVKGRFVHLSADNVDINEYTSQGKGTFHATQVSAWERGPPERVETSANVAVDEASCLLIDGQALVMALGKPPGIKTFGGFANIFAETVFKMGARYQRIDVVFDRCRDESIKSGTRVKRKLRHRPERRKIENDSTVALPSDWSSFTSLEENKADLAMLLSTRLIEHNSTENPVIVVAGGFSESTTVKSSNPDFDVSSLRADHEEGDTRLILHCIHAHMDTIVVSVRDTDVLLLLLAHYNRIDWTRLYMKAGTSKAPKYFPVHDIHQHSVLLLALIVCLSSVVTVKTNSLAGVPTTSH